MHAHENAFLLLADRAGSGDARAQVDFRRQADLAMVPMVRRALNSTDNSPMTQNIRAAARQFASRHPGLREADPDSFIRHVARWLAATMSARVSAGWRLDQAQRETVCA